MPAPAGPHRGRRIGFAALLLLVALGSAGIAGAQTPPRPILGPPPLPVTPVGRGLSQAYGAIVGTAVANPAAAQRAEYGYARALQQARAGDRAGALAASASAQAEAIEGAPVAPVVRAYAPARSAIAPLGARVQPGVPIVENGPALSGDLVVARDELELAGEVPHANLDAAKKTYRQALDDYLAGDAERSQAEARAAFAAAAGALSRVK